jgi:hypothetical protein
VVAINMVGKEKGLVVGLNGIRFSDYTSDKIVKSFLEMKQG